MKLNNDKRKELADRTEQYETWKNDKKRKKNRAAALTGEKPPEEIAYNKDKEILETQISLLQAK